MLFTLYTADIGLFIQTHDLQHHRHADDTQLYFFCTLEESAALMLRVISCDDDIARWIASTRLTLGAAKSESLWCAAARRLDHIDSSVFHLDDQERCDCHIRTQPRRLLRRFDLGCKPTSVDL